jgi:hypothetical protein
VIVAVSDIVKKPKIISDVEDIIYVKDKRKDVLKSIVIPAQYLDTLKEKLEVIEYELWLSRNKEALLEDSKGLLDEVVEDIGKKL